MTSTAKKKFNSAGFSADTALGSDAEGPHVRPLGVEQCRGPVQQRRRISEPLLDEERDQARAFDGRPLVLVHRGVPKDLIRTCNSQNCFGSR